MSVHVRLVAELVCLVLLGWCVSADSQVQVSSEERFFRIQWQLEQKDGDEVAIVGVLDNHYLYRLERVQLAARVFDEAGQTIHEALTTVSDVPPSGRSSFRLALAARGARYAVTVHAFAFGPRESP